MKNKSKLIFFIEEQHYSKESMEDMFDEKYINYLKRMKICLEIKDGTMLKFSFVGLLIYHDTSYLILPKYMNIADKVEVVKKMKLILRVIRKFNKKYVSTSDSINFYNQNSSEEYKNSFALAGYILEDYLNYGYYTVTKNEVVKNGEGEINWSQTIDRIAPVISTGTPYYFDFYTNNDSVDEKNIVLRVHQWAIFHYASLFGEWLGFGNITLDSKYTALKSIGSKEYLISKLKNELNETYIDQKVNLIKVLISIVEAEFSLTTRQLNIYGVRNFEVIWEEICVLIFADEYDNYKEFIPAPLWTNYDSGLTVEKNTLIPDIIKTHSLLDDNYFLILDAKYYDMRFTSENVIGNPSVNDVAKQLLYQKALESSAVGNRIRNYFLFPYDGKSKIKVVGKVSMDFISPHPVVLVYLSTYKVYNMYLNNDILIDKDYLDLELQTNQKAYFKE